MISILCYRKSQMNIKTISRCLISGCMLSLAACATYSNKEEMLSSYLDEFIGKSPTYLKQNINFNALNLQSSNQPIAESNQSITYRILRPVRLPLPSPTAIGSAGGGFTGPSMSMHTSSADAYDVNFNCDIKFHLEANKVIDWKYSGKAC